MWCMCDAGLLKSSALRGGARDVLPDERILAGFEIMAAPTTELLRYLYPQLYTVSDPGGDWGRPTTSGRYTPHHICWSLRTLLTLSGKALQQEQLHCVGYLHQLLSVIISIIIGMPCNTTQAGRRF